MNETAQPPTTGHVAVWTIGERQTQWVVATTHNAHCFDCAAAVDRAVGLATSTGSGSAKYTNGEHAANVVRRGSTAD